MLGDEPAAVIERDDLVAFARRVARRLVGAELQRDGTDRIAGGTDGRRDRRGSSAGRRRARERLRRRRLRDGAGGNGRVRGIGRPLDVHQTGARRADAAAVEVAHHVRFGDAALRTRALDAVEVDAVLLRHVAHHGAGALVAIAVLLLLLLLRGRSRPIGLRRRRRRGLCGGWSRQLLSCRSWRGLLRLRVGPALRGRSGGARLSSVIEARELTAHLNHGAFLREHFDEYAGRGRWDLGVRLVGGNFDEWLIALDPLTRLGQPLHDRAFGDRFAECRHRDRRRRHGMPV